MDVNVITQNVIGASIEVHRALGPGLLESVYEQCLCHELTERNVKFVRQCSLPVCYKGLRIESSYRLDLLVEGSVVVELKAIEKIIPLHDAQLLSYMRLGNWKVGLLINFNVPVLKQGIRRKII